MNQGYKEEERWLSPSEVAAFFHVSPITVRSWANSGQLKPEMTPGGHRRFPMSEVQRFAATRQNKSVLMKQRASEILIVDDDADVANLLGAHIKRILPECEILYAFDGFEAGAVMQEYIPALIFIDIMMPGVKGDAVCRFIKRNPKTRHIPVVGMTGYPSTENLESMKKAGAVTTLAKPFELDALSRLLHQHMNEDSEGETLHEE